MTLSELHRQKIQSQQKDIHAIIRRDFSASRMNTTKWQEVTECLSGLSLSCRMKFVDIDDEVFEVGAFWHVTRDWFDGGPGGPFTSISVEWLDIDPVQKVRHGLLLAPTGINHADELEKRLQAVQVPYYWEGDSIRIVGHVRNSVA